MKKENNDIEVFLKNYRNSNLGLDIYSHQDKKNNLHIFFSLNKIKDYKGKNLISKRKQLIKKDYLLIEKNEEVDIVRLMEKRIKTLIKGAKGCKLTTYTKKDSLENKLISIVNTPNIVDRQEIYDYIPFNALKLFFKDNEAELLTINNKYKKDLVFLDINAYMNKSLKTNHFKLEKYSSEEDLIANANPVEISEKLFNCSETKFKKYLFDELLEIITQLKAENKKVAIRTNFTGENINLLNEEELEVIDSLVLKNNLLDSYFGVIGLNGKCAQLEHQEKIENYAKEQELEYSDLSKYNVLYTDGSNYKNKKVNLTSGAFILDTFDSGNFSGVEVKEMTKILEHEVLAAYLGVLEVVEQSLFNKPLSFIMDSDELAESMINSINNLPAIDISLRENSDFKSLMSLIKDNNLDIKILKIKSHQNYKSNIYIKNEEVDVMALNAIKEKMEQDNIPNNIKKRKLK